MFLQQVGRQLRGLGIGIIASNGMQDMNLILEQLLCRHFQGRIALLDVATLDAILHIGQLPQGTSNKQPRTKTGNV